MLVIKGPEKIGRLGGARRIEKLTLVARKPEEVGGPGENRRNRGASASHRRSGGGEGRNWEASASRKRFEGGEDKQGSEC